MIPGRAPLWRSTHVTSQLRVWPGDSAWRSRLFGSGKSRGTGFWKQLDLDVVTHPVPFLGVSRASVVEILSRCA